MKINIYSLFNIKISIIVSIAFLIWNNSVFGEGTKEFRPDSSYYGNLQINDLNRPFALESNTNPLYRLYFHINDHTTEYVYVGFRHINVSGETATWRIKDPNGNVVRARSNIPTSGTGFINYYSQAVAGPKISLLPANGYTPIVFNPAMNGDFYIEFTTSLQGTSTAYHFDLFDLTVATSTSNRIKGRLWSFCWDLNTRSYSNRYWGKFYSYSDDGYVTEFSMNGIQPYGFTVACNNSGPSTAGDDDENRKSVSGNSTRPQYKIFLNNPDPICYPSGTVPVIMENLALVDTPFVGDPALFTLKMSQPGTVEMVIELNGIDGYQPGSRDVVLVQTTDGGVLDTVVWDGKDGLGETVIADEVIVSSAAFYTGITHFPLYDPETNEYGYIVNRIRPVSGPCKIYWDDSNFPGGTTEIEGQYGPAHTWAYFFGDVRTMNTWWDGFRIDTLAYFAWSFRKTNLPVDLLFFSADKLDNNVQMKWCTATETNNDYFSVERSENGIDFDVIAYIPAAGNSNTMQNYSCIDFSPAEMNYYRLKQTDFNGAYSYSQVVKVSTKTDAENEVAVIAADKGLNVMINAEEEGQLILCVFSLTGSVIYNETVNVEKGNTSQYVKFDCSQNSVYLVSARLNGNMPVNSKVFIN